MAIGALIVALVVLGLIYYAINALIPANPITKVVNVIIIIVAVVIALVFVLNLLGLSTGGLGHGLTR